MEKIKHWYFVVKENNKEVIVSYGDSRDYTQEEAYEKIKKRYPNCKIATKEDMDKLL